MKIAIYLAHPSQYYVFKDIMLSLEKFGHSTFIYIKSKDILEQLLDHDGASYLNVLPKKRGGGNFNIFWSVITKNRQLFRELKKQKIELLLTAASDSAQASYLARIPSIVLNDDDADIIKNSARFGWPFCSIIFAPKTCNMGYWKKKTLFYNAYQKTAYLHPELFSPDDSILKKYGLEQDNYVLLRTVSLQAHHDENIRGLGNTTVKKIIEHLPNGVKAFISSEEPLSREFEEYRLNINPVDIHHLLYYSKLLVGDSQSMAHEAALLGTPSIRFNDFAGRIGVLEELEHEYGLTVGLPPDQENELLKKVTEFASFTKKERAEFRNKAVVMAKEKINLSSLLFWFIENWPDSKNIMLENPEYQNRFK